MKKTIAVLLSLAMIITLFCNSALAYSPTTHGSWTISYTEDAETGEQNDCYIYNADDIHATYTTANVNNESCIFGFFFYNYMPESGTPVFLGLTISAYKDESWQSVLSNAEEGCTVRFTYDGGVVEANGEIYDEGAIALYDYEDLVELQDVFTKSTKVSIFIQSNKYQAETITANNISLNGFNDCLKDMNDFYGPRTSRIRIESFVNNCYWTILDREPDSAGMKHWADKLESGQATAAEIINEFMNSDELRNKNLSYEEAVELLYITMLYRAPDEAGEAYWVSKLKAGSGYGAIINGFCGSDEFREVCEYYGIKPGSVSGGSAAPAPAPAPAPAADLTKIRAFVTRNYRVILGREPDADGLNYWAQRLASGEATAAEIINGFVNSDEFKSKNLSYGDQVEVLYQVMLDRGSDAAGKAYWVSMLNGGNPLAAIINGFCNSVEFKGICAEYGITPGSVNAGEAKPPREEAQAVDLDKIRAYVTRCYRIILGREPDQEGLNYWTGKMATGELQAAAIIDEFVNSIEFMDKQLSDREAVEVLYQAMLGRGSDEAGMGYWLEKLNAGEPFAVIINGFCNSVEFKGICAEYGITPGSVAVASVRTHAEPEEQEIPEAEATEPEQEAEPAPADKRTEQARAFVTHCYQSALLRDPSAEETDYYANQILSGQMTAKDVARAFAFSQEFQGKWTDSTAFVRVLYRLCLDREADADGLVYWTDKLANGETAAAVFNALTENKEFVQVCATYGVPAGVDANAIRAQEEAAAAAEANEAPAAPASEFTNEEKIRAFVSRFYRDAMGREADEEGLNYYTSRILNGEATPKDVAREIILSEEFRGRMPGNEDLVRILYRIYLGREADEEGLANWAGQLDSGVTLETVLNGFAGSEEFAAVVNGLK